jgi:Fur family ferric uptake transcriptional regulator
MARTTRRRAAVEAAGPAVEQVADRVAGEHGFADVSHPLEIFGTCGDCGAAQRKSQTVPSEIT